MNNLGFRPDEWQALCRACRWIQVRNFHRDGLRTYLSRCLGPFQPELTKRIERLNAGQLEELRGGLVEHQAETLRTRLVSAESTADAILSTCG